MLYDKLSHHKKELIENAGLNDVCLKNNRFGDPYLPALRSFVPSHDVGRMQKTLNKNYTG